MSTINNTGARAAAPSIVIYLLERSEKGTRLTIRQTGLFLTTSVAPSR